MRERLQRRKKNSPAKDKEAAPPPLQPAYFNAVEGESSAPPAVSQDVDIPQTTEPEMEPQPAESSADEPSVPVEASSSNSTPDESRRGRGRRRRGGRGRGRGGRGREQAVAQAFAPGRSSVSESSADLAAPPSAATEPEPEAEAPAAEAPVAPAIVPAVPARPPKGIVVLAIGLPGSGKSSWFKRNNVVPLSSDMVRSLLFDDIREQRFQDLVFSNLRSMLKARLIAKRPMNYVDATNLTPQERQHWVKLAKDYNYEVHAVFFDVPLEVCIDRHQRRDRVVPEDVMRRMAAKLKPPSFTEGFAKITVVRVKKKPDESGIEPASGE